MAIPFDCSRPNVAAARRIFLAALEEDPDLHEIAAGDPRYEHLVEWVGPRTAGILDFAIHQAFWQLFLEGIVAPGFNAYNEKFPWFHVTDYGKKMLAGSGAPVHDPDGYLARLDSRISTPDPTRFADALTVLDNYHLDVPPSIQRVLEAGNRQLLEETPKPGSAVFKHVQNIVVASARQSLLAAKAYFQQNHINGLIMGDTVTGEAREIAKAYAALVREIRLFPDALKPPIALLSGGETTVTLTGSGHGGRNAEFLLSLLIALDGMENVYALACDTDGIDGSEDNAGAWIAPDSLRRAKQLGLSAKSYLFNNDAYGFFEKLGNLVVTGPTCTNVNDYRVILIV